MIYEWLKTKKPSGSILKKRINEDILIVCSRDLEVYYLNRTAGFIINAIDGNKSIEDIKFEVLQNFDVDEHDLESDMVDIIRDLQWKQLITLED